tara:strand:- start:4093 stop:4569 length:477 start_codon:yes stop_codon:yes gene_type:complete
MLNLKNVSNLIFLSGLVSYLYLFSSLLNKKYDIIFIYFIILFTGYFIIGKNIFFYNLLIIIIDIINNKFILREGNFESNYEKGKQAGEDDPSLTKEGGSMELDNVSSDDGNEIVDDLDSDNKKTEKKKDKPDITAKSSYTDEATQLGIKDLLKTDFSK